MADDWGLFAYWRDSPWTIKAYAYVQVAWFAFYLLSRDESRPATDPGLGAVVFGVALALLVLYWLIRRSRATRVVATIWTGLSTITGLGVFFGRSPYPTWIGLTYLSFVVVELVVLLHPKTREWCSRRLRLTDPERLSQVRNR